MEDTLADMSVILATMVEKRIEDLPEYTGELETIFDAAYRKKLNARIYELEKTHVDLRMTITDHNGIVLFDSHGGQDVGEDYSEWHDVHSTLNGKYGARTTRIHPDDIFSSIFYVSAPIKSGDSIAGVLTLGKPAENVRLFVDTSRRNILISGALVLVAVLILSFLVSAWITRPIQKLTDYARAVKNGLRVSPPRLGHNETGTLGQAFEEMRDALEGKQYIERYVQNLTHEIKGPLSSIRGASELLYEEMNSEDRNRFISNIKSESLRIQKIVDRMLELASLEKKKELTDTESIDVTVMLQEIVEGFSADSHSKHVRIQITDTDCVKLTGEPFLLRQAIINLIRNAFEFTPEGGHIRIETRKADPWIHIGITDNGTGIPDYALEKIFDRFYSLPRPDTHEKSSGLGLPFVQEVAKLHSGSVHIQNAPGGGTKVVFSLPLD